jgi:hypothetical protein
MLIELEEGCRKRSVRPLMFLILLHWRLDVTIVVSIARTAS